MDYGGGGGDGVRGSMGSGGSQGARKSYDEQTIIPTTARMILNSAEGGSGLCLRDGREIHQVKLIGAVRSVEEQSTNITYQIEDGTGLIEVKQWLGPEDCAGITEMRMQAAHENIYLKIIGQVKDYDGKKSVIGYSVRTLTTGNELTHHFLEVVYSIERYRNAGAKGTSAAPQTSTPYAPVSNHQMNTSFNANNYSGQVQNNSGLSGVTQEVLNYIKTEGERDEVGADILLCAQVFAGKYTQAQIQQSVDSLASEGHIYSTINETKYKCAM